ncbi:MAG: hypothetical protein ACQER9_00885 [Nanobdellota archaeon]
MSSYFFENASTRKIAYFFTGNKYNSYKGNKDINPAHPYYKDIKKIEAIFKAIKSSGKLNNEDVNKIRNKINNIKNKL